MGQILIQGTPRQGAAAVFDPAAEPDRTFNSFSALRFAGTPQSGNVGGRYALPKEFDSNEFASAFVPEGSDVLAMQGEQPVQGTGYVAPGWTPWKYPEHGEPAIDETTGKQKVELKANPNWSKTSGPEVPKEIPVPVFQRHPEAGKIHKVPGREKNDVAHILMCRPLIIQAQVNEIYGRLSIDQMTAEVYGETIEGKPRTDSGMLGEQQLRAARNIDQDLRADQMAEEGMGRSAVLHTTLPHNMPVRLTVPPKKVG